MVLADSTYSGKAAIILMKAQSLGKKIVVHQPKDLALKIRTCSHVRTNLAIGPAVEERKISKLYV